MNRRSAASVNRVQQCLICKADISHRGWQAKFCTTCRDHRRNHYKAALADVPAVVMYDACAGCNLTFEPPRWQQFCSRECQGRNAASQRFKVAIEKQCTACTAGFSTTNPKRTTCTKACMQWTHNHPGVLRILDKECQHCLTPFRADTPRRKYCGSECQLRINQQRRNRRTTHCFIEDVSKTVVATRDKWRCQLCGKRVSQTLQYPHPMSPSLDHVIPIARGGEHSYANTQLAHLTCNIRKRDKTTQPQQLALIG